MSPDLGPWQALAVEEVAAAFASATFRWWISGGHALKLHVGRRWRDHEDIDIGVVRRDLAAVYAHLSGWDLHVASSGHLAPWRGERLTLERRQNNVWCRVAAGGPWALDVTINEGSAERWINRRDARLQVPWGSAVLFTVDGVPYLAPEIQLLFKSRDPRPRDEVDAAEVIPHLDERRRRSLAATLASDHPWQRLLA
jgi:hypothetical protein